jgi:sucrose-6-phosphate hydrolase SacC (GH32 family)
MLVEEAESPAIVPDIQGDTLELRIVFNLRETTAEAFGLHVRRSPGGEEYTAIMFERLSGRLTVNRDCASLADTSYRGVVGGPVDLVGSDRLALHIYLDRSVVEVYANERACLTERIYPVRADSVGAAVVAQGGSACLLALDVWELACGEEVVSHASDH